MGYLCILDMEIFFLSLFFCIIFFTFLFIFVITQCYTNAVDVGIMIVVGMNCFTFSLNKCVCQCGFCQIMVLVCIDISSECFFEFLPRVQSCTDHSMYTHFQSLTSSEIPAECDPSFVFGWWSILGWSTSEIWYWLCWSIWNRQDGNYKFC